MLFKDDVFSINIYFLKIRIITVIDVTTLNDMLYAKQILQAIALNYML